MGIIPSGSDAKKSPASISPYGSEVHQIMINERKQGGMNIPPELTKERARNNLGN